MGDVDLTQLIDLAGWLSKHHDRMFWTAPLHGDHDVLGVLGALEAVRSILAVVSSANHVCLFGIASI